MAMTRKMAISYLFTLWESSPPTRPRAGGRRNPQNKQLLFCHQSRHCRHKKGTGREEVQRKISQKGENKVQSAINISGMPQRNTQTDFSTDWEARPERDSLCPAGDGCDASHSQEKNGRGRAAADSGRTAERIKDGHLFRGQWPQAMKLTTGANSRIRNECPRAAIPLIFCACQQLLTPAGRNEFDTLRIPSGYRKARDLKRT